MENHRLRPRSDDAPRGSLSVYDHTAPCRVTPSEHTPLRIAYFWPLCANMTSFMKPEVVHNVSQRRKRTVQAMATGSMPHASEIWKTGRVVPETARRQTITDEHRDKQTLTSQYPAPLNSANRHLLAVPRFWLNTYGRRAFSVAGPMAWNSLPDFIQDPTSSTDCFRRLLKTYLFARY